MTECNDGLDNDGDGWSDLDDPDCDSVYSDSEAGGYNTVYACNNSLDDDGDGLEDADDPQCLSGWDNNEGS